MDDAVNNGLLPEGLRDGLPPRAAHNTHVVRALEDHFARNGYALVAPPLIEFEAGLRGRVDAGQGNSSDAFRLLDPVSQKTLIVRSDITRQVARIAETRMTEEPRPLRLSYTGSALRTRGSQLQPSRQVRQVGFELIGADGLNAAKELADIVFSAFEQFDLPALTYDLSFPGLIPALCAELGLSASQTEQVIRALDDKDAAGFSALPPKDAEIFLALLAAIGSPQQVMAAVEKIALPANVRKLWSNAVALIDVFTRAVGAERLHVDPGEVHGFSYQAGWALSVFSQGIRGELGKGGAYALTGADMTEPAQGFTFYPDVFAPSTLASSNGQATPKILVPADTSADIVAKLQADGYVTIRDLSPKAGTSDELGKRAAHLRCSAFFFDGRIGSVKAV
ncbi:MAG: ATP phosphoribosyltransferase regulatory subunit [Pseudomonadota bacterium]